ncbi:hypothetical protein EYC08_17070 [Tabrizicola sp. WMC-M-20]|nr:hypothetical protein EYC08_17070 [Tabrizicola sp. WMC-M-20]
MRWRRRWGRRRRTVGWSTPCAVSSQRERFGKRSEKLSPNQFNLPLEDAELAQGVLEAAQEKVEAALQRLRGEPPVPGKLSAALFFLHSLGGRDRTMTWDIHRNARWPC